MNQALKQRLVGAVVLVALAVIFLPALFNGGRQAQTAVLEEVPLAPAVEPLTIVEPVNPSANPLTADEQAPLASEMYAMDTQPSPAMAKLQKITKASSKPELDNKKHPEAWVLQVGVFSDKSRADALKKKLQADKYRAFTRTITPSKNSPDKKTVTRVMIGPELEYATVAKFKAVVDEAYSVKSIVTQFEP